MRPAAMPDPSLRRARRPSCHRPALTSVRRWGSIASSPQRCEKRSPCPAPRRAAAQPTRNSAGPPAARNRDLSLQSARSPQADDQHALGRMDGVTAAGTLLAMQRTQGNAYVSRMVGAGRGGGAVLSRQPAPLPLKQVAVRHRPEARQTDDWGTSFVGPPPRDQPLRHGPDELGAHVAERAGSRWGAAGISRLHAPGGTPEDPMALGGRDGQGSELRPVPAPRAPRVHAESVDVGGQDPCSPLPVLAGGREPVQVRGDASQGVGRVAEGPGEAPLRVRPAQSLSKDFADAQDDKTLQAPEIKFQPAAKGMDMDLPSLAGEQVVPQSNEGRVKVATTCSSRPRASR